MLFKSFNIMKHSFLRVGKALLSQIRRRSASFNTIIGNGILQYNIIFSARMIVYNHLWSSEMCVVIEACVIHINVTVSSEPRKHINYNLKIAITQKTHNFISFVRVEELLWR